MCIDDFVCARVRLCVSMLLALDLVVCLSVSVRITLVPGCVCICGYIHHNANMQVRLDLAGNV